MKKTLTQIISIICIFCLIATSCTTGSAPSSSPAASPAEGVSAQPESADAPETVKLAVMIPLSGTNAESGQMCSDGVNLAIKHINEAGGIKSLGGAKLEAVFFDTTSDPAQSKNVAERALADGSIVAGVSAGISSLTIPMVPAFEKSQVPLVAFANAADLTNQGYQYIFSITNRGSEIGEYQARFVGWLNEKKNANIETVAILYENSANGISSSDGLRARALSIGLDVVFDESYPAGLSDATPIVTAMKNSGAQCVMPFTYMQEAKLIFSTMRDLEYYPVIVGNSCWPSFYEALGDATNGVIASGNWNFKTKLVDDNPEYKRVVDEFKETYGYYMTEHSGPAYMTVLVAAAGLEASGSRDPIALRDSISALKMDVMQLPGKLEFNEKGENIHGMPAVAQWQNGEPVCVFPEEFAGAEYINPADF